jgi:patatin-like phospholipase/acyl hydrolase
MSDINPLLTKRFTAPGPKRILALDGGGIRGALSLGYLEKIEEVLREKHKHLYQNPDDFRLCHYFDLIGGTSTGAIIAAALATGEKAEKITSLYKTLGTEIFAQKKYKEFTINLGFWKRTLKLFTNYKYNSEPLQKNLEAIFKDSVLGDLKNKTGLCILSKRFDTFSTWPVTNNPNARYFSRNRFPLKKIIRASTAAPTFFKPEVMDVGDGKISSFVDGGMSLMNNPAFQLFLIAAVKGYRIAGMNEATAEGKTWQTGKDNLLIVSVGTGRREKKLDAAKWTNPNLAKLAPQVSEQFMNDANELVEAMMQFLGYCPDEHDYRDIDREIGNLKNDFLNEKKHFTYVRYNTELIKNTIDKYKIEDIADDVIESLTEMDRSDNVDVLIKIGSKIAASEIKPGNFPDNFNIKELYDEEVQKRNGTGTGL